jgi:hypothetical protein
MKPDMKLTAFGTFHVWLDRDYWGRGILLET